MKICYSLPSPKFHPFGRGATVDENRLTPCARPEGVPWHMAPKDAETPSATGACGHTIWQHEHLAIGGYTIGKTVGPQFGRMAAFFSRTLKKCGLCLMEEVLAQAACCPMCGEPIIIGSPVSIMGHPEPTTDILPFLAYATRVTIGPPHCFVFCMKCSPGGALTMAGRWTGTAVQRPEMSLMEAILSGRANVIMVTGDGSVTILE